MERNGHGAMFDDHTGLNFFFVWIKLQRPEPINYKWNIYVTERRCKMQVKPL